MACGVDVACSEQPILQENYPFLRQKICLMALIESVFKRDAYDRTMSFQTIAEETRLPLDEVEHLIMKALRCVSFSSFFPCFICCRASPAFSRGYPRRSCLVGWVDEYDVISRSATRP